MRFRRLEQTRMSKLSTHVLDMVRGQPARQIRFDLARLAGEHATLIVSGRTNDDGRTDAPLLVDAALVAGTYELSFHVAEYFAATSTTQGNPPFLDVITLRFTVADSQGNYHVPLLVTPWGYSTYRGS